MVAFTASQVLSAAGLNSAFNELVINAQTGLTYTPVLSDRGGLITLTNASPVTVTIPPFASVAYANGTTLAFIQLGAGRVTYQGGSGVTVNAFGGYLKSQGQYALAIAVKIATNTWVFAGALDA